MSPIPPRQRSCTPHVRQPEAAGRRWPAAVLPDRRHGRSVGAGPGHPGWLLLLAMVCPALWAQQYESESRVVSRSEAQQVEDFKPEEALKQAEGNPYAQAMILRELAAKAMSENKPDAAAAFLKRALDTRALSSYAAREMQKQLAVVLAEKEDYPAVIRELAPLLAEEKDPDPALLLVLGGAYTQVKRYAEALPLIERALKQTRSPPHDWHALAAAAAAGLKRWEQAVRHIEDALRLAPGELNYWRQLTAYQVARKDALGALAAMDLAFRLGLLESGEDRMRFAQLFFANQIPFEAASLIQGAMEAGLLPRDAQTLEVLAAAWVAAREYLLAIPVLQDAAAATGKAEIYLQLAQLQFDRGEWDGAIRALRTALRKGAGRQAGPARLMLGVALYQQQDFDGARQAFSAAAESKSHAEEAGQWLTYLDSGLAREQAIRMAAARPQDAGELSGRFAGGRVSLSAAGEAGGAGGSRFTPVGAERSGTPDGRIPAWTGGLQQADWPAGFRPGERLKDPYPQDRPLYQISAQNWQEHKEDLSLGHRALLTKYPDYRMAVYPSRRSVSYPQAIYDATQENRGRAKLIGSDALTGARLGFPFPSPRNGVEAMWNHRVRFRGNATVLQSRQALVLADGTVSEQFLQVERVLYLYANTEKPSDLSRDNILLYYLTYFASGAGDLAFTALVHESANSLERERSIWVIPKGISKMFRIPPVGYDNPFPGSGGVAFVDMVDMYNGAFDRYDWKILGKREVLLPYNAYRLNDARRPNAELLQAQFMRPDSARYELHRVWLIEANERGGKRHSFGARRFYLDEDSWNVVLVENYDRQGELWRFQEGHLLPVYDQQFTNALPVVTYDLKDGRYFINRLTNDDPMLDRSGEPPDPREFRPAAVKARYAR